MTSFLLFFHQLNHSVHRVWSPSSIENPRTWPFPLYIFSEPSDSDNNIDDVRGKHKKKIVRESYFLMFRRIQNNVTFFFFISNAFVCHTSLIWSSLFYNTSTRHERHECNTSETRATRVQHKCDTSATWTTRVRHEWKTLIFITAQVKTYCHTSILAIWQMKDYKERNNFIQRTTFWKCLVPMPKCIWKEYHKIWTL